MSGSWTGSGIGTRSAITNNDAKPFSYPELRGRVAALLRRADRRPHGRLRAGPLEVDPPSREVRLHGDRVALSQKEFTLLRTLVSDPSRVFTKEELLRTIWGYRSIGSTRTLDSHACRLRHKLGIHGDRYVINVWGQSSANRDSVSGSVPLAPVVRPSDSVRPTCKGMGMTTTEELLERARKRRMEPDRDLLARAIELSQLSQGEIGRRVGPGLGKSAAAVQVKLSKFLSGHDRTMSVGFHEAVVGALIDGMADRNGGEVVSDADRDLTEALALDRVRAEIDEEIRELAWDIGRHETALDLAETRRQQVLADREDVMAGLVRAVERAGVA